MSDKNRPLPALNGVSIDSITVEQDGELRIVFDLEVEQTTYAYQRELQGSRSLDVYDYPKIQRLCRDLFRAVREVALQPDPEFVNVHCNNCRSSDCCRKYNVLVTDQDIDRLRSGLKMSAAAFRKKYLTDAVDWCEDYQFQLVCDEDDEDEKCIFLKDNGSGQMRCSVYEHRPQICRDYDMRTCTDFVSIDEIEEL